MGFSLSGMMAGAGKGMAEAGQTLVTAEANKLATLDIDKERAAVQALRDERLQTFTTSERVAHEGYLAGQTAQDRAQKDRHHKDTIERVDRTTIKDLHSNLVKEKQQLLTAITADPTDAQSRARLAEVNKDIVDVTSLAKSKLGSGAKADPKAGKGRDYSSLPGMPKKPGAAVAGPEAGPAPAKAGMPAFDPMAAIAGEMGTERAPAADDYSGEDETPAPSSNSLIGRLVSSAPGSARPTSKAWYSENRAKLIKSGKYTPEQIEAMDKKFGIQPAD